MSDTLIIKQEMGTNGVWLEAETKFGYTIEEAEWKGLSGLTRFEAFRVTDHSRFNIGSFCLSPLPGCCGIVVSHASVLTKDNQHTGMSNPFRELKETVCRKLGYSLMLATNDMSNIPSVGNMFKSRYHIVDTFVNNRTKNLIGLGIKKI